MSDSYLLDILVVACPVLASPNNGSVQPCGKEYQSLCNSTCNPGYIVSAGDLSRKCQATGFWSGEGLKCSGNEIKKDNFPQ